MTTELTLTERKPMTTKVLGVLSVMSSAMGAYHGYRRNQSLGWALWWAMMGGMFPVVTPAIALAQGFGSPRRGLAGLGGIGRPQWVTARYSGPLGLDLVVWSTHKTRATAMEFALRRNRQFGAVNPEEGPFRAYQVGPGAPYEMISVFGKRMLRSVVGSREQHSGLADLGSGVSSDRKRFFLAFTCIDLDSRDMDRMERLEHMIDVAKPVSYQTFHAECSELDEWAAAHGYDTGNDRGGLRLSKDPLVSFYRSVWGKTPCYFMDWSRIEHVWLPGGNY